MTFGRIRQDPTIDRRDGQVPHPRPLGHARPPGQARQLSQLYLANGVTGVRVMWGNPAMSRAARSPTATWLEGRHRGGQARRDADGRRQQHPRRPEADLAGDGRRSRTTPRSARRVRSRRPRLRGPTSSRSTRSSLAEAFRAIAAEAKARGDDVRRARPGWSGLGRGGFRPRHEEHGAPLRDLRRMLVDARPRCIAATQRRILDEVEGRPGSRPCERSSGRSTPGSVASYSDDKAADALRPAQGGTGHGSARP